MKEARKHVDVLKVYHVADAVALLKKISFTKFDPTVEIAIKTYANPKYNDQMMRWTMSLPHGTGKTVRVAVYCPEDKIEDMKKAGADIAGWKELLDRIEKGDIAFDVLVTDPMSMRDLARVAKTLGPKWLMPSPKAGTVSQDVVKAVAEIKKGRIEYKIDKTGNIHGIVGKLSFDDAALVANIREFIKTMNDNKPTGVKGKLIKTITIAATMTPGVKIAE